MLLILTATFAVSWLPLYTIMLICYYGYSDTVCPNVYATIQPIFQWLGASNSCVNPIIYCFASHKWRMEFREVVLCVNDRGQRPLVPVSAARTCHQPQSSRPRAELTSSCTLGLLTSSASDKCTQQTVKNNKQTFAVSEL